jgi:NAD(P)-dependent dehydrogenase (short-subunit alcohol dehydrogenase family)
MRDTFAHRFDLTGQVAVITGASRGIGAAIAEALAAAGARVVLASRKLDGLEEVAGRIRAAGGETLTVACHTGRAAEVEALAARAAEVFGGIDVLVNNAATNPHFGPLLDASEAQWDKTFEVNVKGYVHAIRACVPRMRGREPGGRIVNVASVAGLVPHGGLGVYGVSKAAVLMLTRTLAAELAPEIRVNAIAPGLIATRFSEALWSTPEARDRALAAIPQRRIGQPDDLVGAVLYLASDASRYTTGTVIVVDGGQTLGGAY